MPQKADREVATANRKVYDELYERLDTKEGKKGICIFSMVSYHTDTIFALRRLVGKYREGQKELHCVY